MTTTTMHANVQRSRFTHHSIAVFLGLLPEVLRRSLARSAAPSAAMDVERVRALAATYAESDPGFASDLYAAAARHEGAAPH